MPNAMPPCGGAPIAQRVEQEAEPRPLLLGVMLEDVEDLRLQLRLVDPERPAAELVAVADEVVGDGAARRPGPCRSIASQSGVGRVNGMVRGRPALVLLRTSRTSGSR